MRILILIVFSTLFLTVYTQVYVKGHRINTNDKYIDTVLTDVNTLPKDGCITPLGNIQPPQLTNTKKSENNFFISGNITIFAKNKTYNETYIHR